MKIANIIASNSLINLNNSLIFCCCSNMGSKLAWSQLLSALLLLHILNIIDIFQLLFFAINFKNTCNKILKYFRLFFRRNCYINNVRSALTAKMRLA